MHNIITFVLVTALLTASVTKGDEDALDVETESALEDTSPPPSGPEPAASNATEKLAVAMATFHLAADTATKHVRSGLLSTQESTELYRAMADALHEVLDLLDNTETAYYFLKAKGFDTIVARYLELEYTPLRSSLLQLTKTLFDIAPTTTKSLIPSRILDKFLEIFQDDDNASTKAQIVDVLSVWLPGNPEAQARVMMLSGLEPFYKQMSKLDTAATGSMLELFSKIIKEHEEKKESRADFTASKLYQQIGLIEQISTARVCNGLLDLFSEGALSKGQELLTPVLGLLRTVRPYCAAVYRGRDQAEALLLHMAKFVQDPTNDLEDLHVDAAEWKEFLDEFLDEVTTPRRDEL